MKRNEFERQDSLFQDFFESETTSFFSYEDNIQDESSVGTPGPKRYALITFAMSSSVGKHYRRAYDAITFLGDMGGLYGTIRGFTFLLNHLLGCTDPKIDYLTKLFSAKDN